MKYKLLSHIIDNSTPSYGNRDKVVIKTNSSIINGESANTSKRTFSNNPGLHPNLASYFRSKYKKLRRVGFDFISLTSWKHSDEGRKSRKEFLCPTNKEPILVIEDMKLSEIVNPLDQVIVAPIMIEDGNGGNVTIFAKEFFV